MKKLNVLLLIALLLVGGVLSGLLIQNQFGKYSPHKWHEGYREDVINDVMENYVYPGVSVADVETYIGTGTDESSELKDKILSLFEYQNDEANAYESWIYEIEYDVRDDDNMENSYFVVIHNGDVVLKTMLVDSLT